MVDIRPQDLNPAVTPIDASSPIIIDQGLSGVNRTTSTEMVNAVAPVASKTEAEVGTDDVKRMTALKTKQSIASEVGVTVSSYAAGQAGLSAVQSVNGKSGISVTLVKGDVGLGNVDNTSDANKPISTATQTALNLKADDSVVVKSVNGELPVSGNVTVSAEEKRLQDTRTSAIAESFGGNILFIETSGYSSVGDGGGALYKRVSSEPSHAGKVQSSDGAWWELVPEQGEVNTRQFGVKHDGTTETVAMQQAINYATSAGVRLVLSSGSVTAAQLSIAGSLEFVGRGDATMKWPNEACPNNANPFGSSPIAQLDVVSPGISVLVEGVTFDGNEANQSAVNPTGAAIRMRSVVGPRTNISRITVRGCTFKNLTQQGVIAKGLLKGNESQLVDVIDCTFINGRKGMGRDDPSSTNALGFMLAYVDIIDHVQARVTGCSFKYLKTLGVGEYGPIGVRATYNEAPSPDSGATIQVIGNDFERCGRSEISWDGLADTNNGLGNVDFYGRANHVIVTNNVFKSGYNAGVRGKTNVNLAVISGNIIEDTPNGISITPTTTSDQAGRIIVANNHIIRAEQFGIAIVANLDASPNRGSDCVIANNVVTDTRNAKGRGLGDNTAGILVRRLRYVVVEGNVIAVTATNVSGILCREMQVFSVSGNVLRGIGAHGIYVRGAVDGSCDISGNTAFQTGLTGLIFEDASASAAFTVQGNTISAAGQIGIDANVAMFTLALSNNTIRAQVAPATYPAFRTGAGVNQCSMVGNITNNNTTPYQNNTGASVKQAANSWS